MMDFSLRVTYSTTRLEKAKKKTMLLWLWLQAALSNSVARVAINFSASINYYLSRIRADSRGSGGFAIMSNKSAYKFSMDRCTTLCLRSLSFDAIKRVRARFSFAASDDKLAESQRKKTRDGDGRRSETHSPGARSPYSPDRIPAIITSSTA